MLKNRRFFLFSWLIIPLIVLWIGTNYLIGINRKTVWEIKNNPKEESQSNVVLGTESLAEDIKPVKWENKGLITVWFDDSWESQFTVAYPLLNENGIKAALSVPTGLVGYDNYMSWNQIKLLRYKGWEITAHSKSHSCTPTDWNNTDFIDGEMNGSYIDLKNQGIAVTNFVEPCGIETDLVKSEAKKYYTSLRTTIDGFNSVPVSDPYSLKIQTITWDTNISDIQKWIDAAKNNKEWLILVFHQIQDNQEKYAYPIDKFNQAVNLIKSSDLQNILPMQAIQLEIVK